VDNRGDGIRLWSCENIDIKNNSIFDSRDISINRSKNVRVSNNIIKDSRYCGFTKYEQRYKYTQNSILSTYAGVYIQGGKELFISKK